MENDGNEKQYAEIIIDTPARELDRPFNYSVPADLRDGIEIGSLVLVPLGRRQMVGYVVGFLSKPGVTVIKDITRVLDEPPIFDFDSRRLCQWIAEHYLSSQAHAFKLVIPPGRGRKVKQYVSLKVEREVALAKLEECPEACREIAEVLASCAQDVEKKNLQAHVGSKPIAPSLKLMEDAGIIDRKYVLTQPNVRTKSRKVVRLSDGGAEADPDSLPARQRDLFLRLKSLGGVQFQSDLLRDTGTSSSSLKSLSTRGLIEITTENVTRQPLLRDGSEDGRAPIPNEHQQVAIDRVSEYIDEGRHGIFLLEGVTGSGKTEIYLRSIQHVLSKGKSAIVLVPEISLTPQTLERFESRFPGNVAVLHSRLGPGERLDQWRGVREGRYRVVVGARSAVFAPVSDLGLIAIDEEHESSYKNDTTPRYHAREVAEARARMAGAVLILGSATPSFESIQRARAGIYELLSLPRRIDDRPLPDVEIVDMRETGGAGEVPLLSPRLLDAVTRTVEAGDQVILFLNRRGFANYMQCHTCGQIMGCDDCEVSLCYHFKGNILMCHHCGITRDVPSACPVCGKGPLKPFGAGTERVEKELVEQIPGISFSRMDSDTTRGKDAHRKLLASFKAREAQVLIGTQMIAKGLDIPGVTLVGVINADTALALPDFRASERTYQLLTQVSGRAGRGLRPGRVIVQTFNPGHPAITALTGDASAFVEKELETRLHALYPPFVQLVNILVTAPDLKNAARGADRLRKILENDLLQSGASILGPAPSPLTRIRGRYRWHIIVKCQEVDLVAGPLRKSVGRFYEYSRTFDGGRDVRISLDADPSSLL